MPRKKNVRLKEGLHYGIPAEVYHADPCAKASLNSSIAKILVSETPIKAWVRHPRLNKKYKPTRKEEFDFGSAAHALILEGKENSIYVIDSDSYRSDAAKEQREIAWSTGKIPVLAHKMHDIEEMASAFHYWLDKSEDIPKGIFQNGKPEVTGIWREGKHWMRMRLDLLLDDHSFIFDLKTSASADEETFIRGPLVSLKYDVSAAFYLRGINAINGGQKKTNFVWLVQETEPPYVLSTVFYSAQMEEIAEDKIEHAIKIWCRCVESKEWPGYGRKLYRGYLPGYAVSRWEEWKAMQGFITSSEQMA